MFKIEKGIEIPPAGALGRSQKYPFADMDVGDSFFVANDSGKSTADTTARLNNAKNSATKRLVDRKFAVRPAQSVDDNGEVVEGARVWRIE